MFYNEQAGYGYQQVYPQVPAQRAADPFLNPGTYGTPAQQQQMAQQQQQVVAHPAGSNIFGAHATPAPSYPVPVPAWAVRAAAPGSSAPAASAAPGFAAPFAVPGAPVAPTGAPAYGYPSAYSYAPPSALQPQQLESVSKDEDPVYGPVGRARGKIERALTSDVEISPELAQTLLDGELRCRGVEVQNCRANIAATEPYTAPPSATAAFRVARVTKSTPLPDALHRELNCELV
jgi:nuclear pore complex protein Nup155